MDGRAIGTSRVGILTGCCALWLAACSSQAASDPGADAAVDRQVDGVDIYVSEQLPPDGANCAPTSHALVRQAPPSDCTFTLDSAPPSPSVVRVLAGTSIIPPSDTNGWVYEPRMLSITLSGSYCQSVRDGTLGELRMIFGCTGSPIP
jgi:hypothetical protein